MSKYIGWIVIGIISLVVLFLGVSSIISYNNFVDLETRIDAVDKDMQNVHASIFNNIKSQGLTVEKYGTLVVESIKVSMGGRYGSGGSKAAFQWIKENNPGIDSKIFYKLQNVIEAGYNSFEATQRTKIDIVRVYKKNLRSFPSNIVAWVFNFPKIDLKSMEEVISTAETKETFQKKEMKTINPFN